MNAEGFSRSIRLGSRFAGVGHPCYVIAEAGVNHNGDPDLAHRLVDAAVAAGADAVKFQTFRADRLVTLDAPKARYQAQSTNTDESQYQMLRRLELSPDTHEALIAHCKRCGIDFLSTPFEEDSVDALVDLGLTCLKLPSGEITNIAFLDHVARKQLPIILSTGMASLDEVRAAVAVFRAAGNTSLILLHCVSSYPARPAECNLRAMDTMRHAFGVPVGYSDHTLGIEVALAATALGACVLEKHFTLDRTLPGPDHKASLEPAELTALVRGVRIVESALGDGEKVRQASEEDTAAVARKSIVAACDIPKGVVITSTMLAIRRPGTGLMPTLLPELIGRTSRQYIAAGTVVSLEMFQ